MSTIKFNPFVQPISKEDLDSLEKKLRTEKFLWTDISNTLSMNELPASVVEQWAKDHDSNVRAAAVESCAYREDLMLDVISRGVFDLSKSVRLAALTACKNRGDIPIETIKSWSLGSCTCERKAAMAACDGLKDMPWFVIDRGLHDEDGDVRYTARNAFCTRLYANQYAEAGFPWCARIDTPLDFIKKWAEDENSDVRKVALWASWRRKDIQWGIIDRGLNDQDPFVKAVAEDTRKALVWLCKDISRRSDIQLSFIDHDVGIPLDYDIIEKWASDKDPKTRILMLSLCESRADAPWRIVEKGLLDPRKEVREAAKAICLG